MCLNPLDCNSGRTLYIKMTDEDYYYFDEHGNLQYKVAKVDESTPIPSCSEGFIPIMDPDL
jgi:hypothetical protein